MSLEQKLRDNLEAAGRALIVPETKRAPLPKPARGWSHGLRFALAGAATVVVLAVPALILLSGGTSPDDRGASITPSTGDVESTGGDTSLPPTSATLKPDTTIIVESQVVIDEITFGDYRLTLTASRLDEEEPPTATVSMRVTSKDDGEIIDEAVVGSPAGFFWFTLTGSDAVCEFKSELAPEGAEVSVQLLLSPSLGCSEQYRFGLSAGELTPAPQSPDEVARQFVGAWEAGDQELMSELAEAQAMTQVEVVPVPVKPMFSHCEGAAGSSYCTFEVSGGELVVRVRNEPPGLVTELIFVPD
jgi:hypothetical protein